jgi:hypothetical protein|tara:strand:+ start:1350 stop:1610 length:261 start_codon:yes stop_codon:yes gene_type:complete
MSETKEKIYLPSSIKEINTKYGTMMVANLKVEDLQKNSKNGWISMVISERREPSEKGATHYAYVNDYKPTEKPKSNNKSNDDDLPF